MLAMVVRRVKGIAWLPVMVILLYGMFPVTSESAMEELVPTNPALRVEGHGESVHDRFGWGWPCWGCDAGAVDPAVHAVADEGSHNIWSVLFL